MKNTIGYCLLAISIALLVGFTRSYFILIDLTPKLIDYLNVTLYNTSSFDFYRLSIISPQFFPVMIVILYLSVFILINSLTEMNYEYKNMKLLRYHTLKKYLIKQQKQLFLVSLQITVFIGIVFLFCLGFILTRKLFDSAFIYLVYFLIRYLFLINLIGVILIFGILVYDVSKIMFYLLIGLLSLLVVDLYSLLNIIKFTDSLIEVLFISGIYLALCFFVYSLIIKCYLHK